MPDLREREVLLSDNPTPPPRQPHGPWWRQRTTQLLGGGVIGGVGVLAIILAIDSGMAPPATTPTTDEMHQITGTGPAPLDRSRVAEGGLGDPDMGFDLSEGGWIQIAAPDGRLWQQYTCSFLDPSPDDRGPGWIEMADPVVEQYLSNGSVMVLKGDRAVARTPGQRLEGGRLTGAVTVEFFEADGDGEVDRGVPANMVLTTQDVVFDNQLGEITCPGEVTISTPQEMLVGEALTIVLNDIDQRIEHLHLATLHYMMLTMTDQGRSQAAVAGDGGASGDVNSSGSGDAPDDQRSPQRDPTWYELRLPEEVVIQQGSVETGRLLQGDKLTVRFAMQVETAPPSKTAETTDPSPGRKITLASATFRTNGVPTPGDHQTLVTCIGPVTMSPWHPGAADQPRADDAIIELSSDPSSTGVRIDDRSMDAVIRCSTAAWQTASTQLDLARGHLDHIQITTPTLRGEIDHLTLDQHAGTVVATAGGGGRTGQLMVDEDDSDDAAPSSITWTESLDLSFTPADQGDDPVLEKAVFTGDVQFHSADGSLNSPTITIDFAPAGDGRATPTQLHADGGVDASDAQGMAIWAHVLTTTFLPPDTTAQSPTPTSETQGLLGDGVRVDRVHAAGDVQVKTSEDARIFADDLHANVQTGRLELSGDDVVIAHDRMLIHHGTNVIVTRKNGQARWNGGGTGWLLASPLDLGASGRITRPATPTSANDPRAATMQTQWTDELIWHGDDHDGAGSVELHGDVRVRNRPAPHERSEITSDHLHLHFTAASTEATSDGGDDSDLHRQLHTFVATGDARMQHWTWAQDDADSPPDLFYIAADHIEYDDITLEAHVPTAGELVIRQAGSAKSGPLLGAGTTQMTWKKALDLTRKHGDIFTLDLTEDVTVVHAGETPDDTGTLAAGRVMATILRSATHGEAREDRLPDLELGGTFDVTRILATQGVHLRARGREVDASTLDYNPRTSVTTILGRPGRTATIRTQGAPQVVRAEKFIWRMDENAALDTVTIIKGVTSGGE